MSRKNLVSAPAWPPLNGVKILAAGTKVEPPGATFGPRTQFCWELIWVREGVLSAEVDGQPFDGRPGTVLLIPPGAIDGYDWSWHCRTSHSFLHFDFCLPSREWPPPASWPRVRQVRHTHPLLALFEHLVGGVLASPASFGALAISSVEMLLRLYLAHDPGDSRESTALPEVVEGCLVYVRRAIAEETGSSLSLARLAAAAYVTPQHLCRVFRNSLRLRPMEVVRLMKVDHSVTYLERTELQVKDIAMRCGFKNPFHFSRAFSAAFGMSPTAYRQAFRRGHVARTVSPVLQRLAAQRILVDEDSITRYIERSQTGAGSGVGAAEGHPVVRGMTWRPAAVHGGRKGTAPRQRG